jgi:AcrR family transcriptional regulator
VLDTGVVRERADAARNRVRVLTAAERLFSLHGVAAVTMDDVAAAAGVGKGTLYRRFGDKGGLAVALLDSREQALQQQILTGQPALGPGAPPAARLASFIEAYLKGSVASSVTGKRRIRGKGSSHRQRELAECCGQAERR